MLGLFPFPCTPRDILFRSYHQISDMEEFLAFYTQVQFNTVLYKSGRNRISIFDGIFINQISTLSTKVFVTGGTGFLGAYVIKELVEKKFAVSAIRRSSR